MCDVIINRIDNVEENLKRVAQRVQNRIKELRQELYNKPINVKRAMIVTNMLKIERSITDYENQCYLYKRLDGLSDCVDEVKFSDLCNTINKTMCLVTGYVRQTYNITVANDVRLWIKKIQDRLENLEKTENLKNELEKLEEIKDSIYITEYITENENYSLVKEIFEYAQYFKSIENNSFLRRSDNLFLYIGTTVILEEFESCLCILNECKVSLRNAVLDYISEIQLFDNIIEMKKEN